MPSVNIAEKGMYSKKGTMGRGDTGGEEEEERTNKTMQLMEDSQRRALRCDAGVFEKSALFWEYGFPSCVRGVGGGAECMVVAEDFFVVGYYC